MPVWFTSNDSIFILRNHSNRSSLISNLFVKFMKEEKFNSKDVNYNFENSKEQTKQGEQDRQNQINENQKSHLNSKFLDTSKISYRFTNIRWIALASACLILLGSYCSYDFPGYLQSFIIKDVLNEASEETKNFQFNLLYSVYSIPNIILPLCGGILIDFIGNRIGLLVFSFILLIGQGICSYGGFRNSFMWLIVGRVIFGSGAECLSVAQSTIVSKWFKGRQLSFSLGTNITVTSLGTVISSYILVPLYQVDNSLFLPLFVCFLVCVFSFLSACILTWLDKRNDEMEGEINIIVSEQDKVRFQDIKNFSFSYYLLSTSCVINYCSIFCLLSNLQDLLVKYYSISQDTANHYISIPYFMGAFLTPFFGLWVDFVGKRGLFLILSSCFLVVSNFLFFFFEECPDQSCNFQMQIILPLTFMGIFYSIYGAVFWPCIALVSETKCTGIAYGLTTSIQNLGLTTLPLLVGIIVTAGTTQEYQNLTNFFFGLAIFALLINIAVYIQDLNNSGSLNLRQKGN